MGPRTTFPDAKQGDGMKKLLSGNEAVARGAYECGVTFGSGYPGTPSTEILESLAQYPGVDARWAPNEKVAYESAVGASLGGARALVTMKHVGVNVAADPLFSHSYMGVGAGLVVVSADDPGMHSSQNEQDNRWLAKAAKIPMLEPSTTAEAKEYTRIAFEISEDYDTPVMLRMTTRVCHAVGEAELSEPRAAEAKPFHRDPGKFVLLPANARRRHLVVEERMRELKVDASSMKHINFMRFRRRDIGIISAGAAWLYAMEAFPEASHLKLGLTNPLPESLIREFAQSVERLIVIEELDPYLEEQIRAMGITVEGRDLRPDTGELNPEIVRAMIEKPLPTPLHPALEGISLPPRPPVLCAGCGHRGVFSVLKQLDLIVAGDIGCYTLGALQPLNAMDSCLCMGASVGMLSGLSRTLPAEDAKRVVGVIGDSTFIHSGITGLIDAVYNGGSGTLLVLDNRTTAMTGHQEHPATGKRLSGEAAPRVDIPALARAVGVKRVRTADAYHLMDLEKAIREEMEADTFSVIVVQNGCVLHERLVLGPPVKVDGKICTHCEACLSVGCPAIGFAEHTPSVNAELCNGCGVCQQVCWNCPAANDVGGFLQLALEGRYDEAYTSLLRTNPFPAITGRVCPHPCEHGRQCAGARPAQDRRRALRRARQGIPQRQGQAGVDPRGGAVPGRPRPPARAGPRRATAAPRRQGRDRGKRPRRPHRRLLSGAAGLSGDALRAAPRDRGDADRRAFPRSVCPARSCSSRSTDCVRCKVTFRPGVAVGRDVAFEKLDREFDAIFIATGFSEARPMGVPGEDLSGVVHGVSFLRDLNFGRKTEIGKHVLVVGGGNTAVDVARSVKRFGATPVVVYRRALEDMPAIPEDVRDLVKEGIEIIPFAAPTRIDLAGGRLEVTFVRMKPGAPDASGRRAAGAGAGLRVRRAIRSGGGGGGRARRVLGSSPHAAPRSGSGDHGLLQYDELEGRLRRRRSLQRVRHRRPRDPLGAQGGGRHPRLSRGDEAMIEERRMTERTRAAEADGAHQHLHRRGRRPGHSARGRGDRRGGHAQGLLGAQERSARDGPTRRQRHLPGALSARRSSRRSSRRGRRTCFWGWSASRRSAIWSGSSPAAWRWSTTTASIPPCSSGGRSPIRRTSKPCSRDARGGW